MQKYSIVFNFLKLSWLCFWILISTRLCGVVGGWRDEAHQIKQTNKQIKNPPNKESKTIFITPCHPPPSALWQASETWRSYMDTQDLSDYLENNRYMEHSIIREWMLRILPQADRAYLKHFSAHHPLTCICYHAPCVYNHSVSWVKKKSHHAWNEEDFGYVWSG